jgi:hypothetical protein
MDKPQVRVTDSEDKVHGFFDSLKEAYDYIKNYKPPVYYLRQVYLDDDRVMVDYGSHTHFFYLDNVPQI